MGDLAFPPARGNHPARGRGPGDRVTAFARRNA
jgi:hypothetical protein